MLTFDAPQRAIATMVETWIQDHPLIAWFLTHPLLSLGMLLIGFILLRGLLGAIAQLTERIWLALLRAPMQLFGWMFGAIASGFRSSPPTPTPPELPSTKQRLADILDRLEALKQEQDALLQEVRTMLGTEQL